MPYTPQKIFWKEVDIIQARHAIVFPASQKRFIAIRENNSVSFLVFLKGYNLSTEITNEIKFAFKLCCL
jgi:hypothetical protein